MFRPTIWNSGELDFAEIFKHEKYEKKFEYVKIS